MDFENSWQRASLGLGVPNLGVELRQALLLRYAESHRAYHTQQHLAECLTLFEQLRAQAKKPAEVEMALWFHDAIYDVHRHDNEEQSAAWAVQVLSDAGVAPDVVERIRNLVLITKHTGVAARDDEKLLIDIDLAILGAQSIRFDQYEEQIKAEYSFVPDELFNEKRAEILRSFVQRPVIYHCESVRNLLESRARENLDRSLARLSLPTQPSAEPIRAQIGVSRLYGAQAASALQGCHVMVVGIGGVGSWAAEALARSGVGHLSLVDLDVIAESNINRQIHALQNTLGRNKVDVMSERIASINSHCNVRTVDDFLTIENLPTLLNTRPDFVIDAIDSPRVKSHLIAYCVKNRIGLAVAGAAGGRDDPLALCELDLALTTGDALLANTRSRLRRDFGFSRNKGERFKVRTVFSQQTPLKTIEQNADGDQSDGRNNGRNNGAPLNCAGYGSIVTVTAAMGLALASIAMKHIINK